MSVLKKIAPLLFPKDTRRRGFITLGHRHVEVVELRRCEERGMSLVIVVSGHDWRTQIPKEAWVKDHEVDWLNGSALLKEDK